VRTLRFILIAAVLAALALALNRSVDDTAPLRGGGEIAWGPVSEQVLSHGRFENFPVYAPHGTPRGFILLLSGVEGWNPSLGDLARRLALDGAMVAGLDEGRFAASLDTDGGTCVFPDGDMENLSHFVQAYFRLPTYLTPILVGDSAGGTLAYAMLIQAPANTFGGAVSLHFCPTLTMQKGLCKTGGLDYRPRDARGFEYLPAPRLPAAWLVLQPAAGSRPAATESCDGDGVQRFLAQVPGVEVRTIPADATLNSATLNSAAAPMLSAVDSLLAKNAPASFDLAPAALADLPIVTVPVPAGVAPANTFAIMLSGDGGWAGLDKDVAAALTADGIAVVGLDSLRYFWTARTPAGLAKDLDRMIDYYLKALGKQQVVLIGYSQGADVLPFAVNRLHGDIRSHVALTAIMGMSEHALFEFHMTNWLQDDDSGLATMPEVDKITAIPVLCVYGSDETDSLCPHLDPHKVKVVELKGGHHFDGNYAALAHTIIAAEQP